MMNKNILRSCAVLLLLLAVFCVVAFAAPFGHTAVFWLGFGFGAFALLFQLYIVYASRVNGDARSRFYGFPVLRVGACFLAAQMVASLAEMALARNLPAWPVLIVNTVLAALMLIGCITVEAVRDEALRQDAQVRRNTGGMRELQSLAASLAEACEEEELKKPLRELADALRYSDPVSSEQTELPEAQLRSRLEAIREGLAGGDSENVRRLCAKAMGDLAERNRICKLSKQGEGK